MFTTLVAPLLGMFGRDSTNHSAKSLGDVRGNTAQRVESGAQPEESLGHVRVGTERTVDMRALAEQAIGDSGRYVVPSVDGDLTLLPGQATIIDHGRISSSLCVGITGSYKGKPVDCTIEIEASEGSRGYVSCILRSLNQDTCEIRLATGLRSENNNGGGLFELWKGCANGQVPGRRSGDIKTDSLDDIRSCYRNELGESGNFLLADQTPITSDLKPGSDIYTPLRQPLTESVLEALNWLKELHLTLYRFGSVSSPESFGVLRVAPDSLDTLKVSVLK